MVKEKKCNGCKNKPLMDLNKEKIDEGQFSPLVKVLIFLYTSLSIYGVVRLVMDLNYLFKNIF